MRRMPIGDECGYRRAGDAIRVKVISQVREFAPFAGRPDSILRPPEEDCDLGDVERTRAVLEHLWNTIVVHGWGPLVMATLGWYYAAQMNSLGW